MATNNEPKMQQYQALCAQVYLAQIDLACARAQLDSIAGRLADLERLLQAAFIFYEN